MLIGQFIYLFFPGWFLGRLLYVEKTVTPTNVCDIQKKKKKTGMCPTESCLLLSPSVPKLGDFSVPHIWVHKTLP